MRRPVWPRTRDAVRSAQLLGTTAAGPDVRAFEREARQRHLRACVRALEARGWQQRLAPLAQALVDLRLVRGRNEHGAPLRRLDAEVLRETLCRLLSEGDEGALLVFELVVEGMDPEWVAQDRGGHRARPDRAAPRGCAVGSLRLRGQGQRPPKPQPRAADAGGTGTQARLGIPPAHAGDRQPRLRLSLPTSRPRAQGLTSVTIATYSDRIVIIPAPGVHLFRTAAAYAPGAAQTAEARTGRTAHAGAGAGRSQRRWMGFLTIRTSARSRKR
jgi:hypothetical protein